VLAHDARASITGGSLGIGVALAQPSLPAVRAEQEAEQRLRSNFLPALGDIDARRGAQKTS
jgi:hypothetical protein